MNDRSKRFTITVNVDAKIKVVRARPRNMRAAIPIDIDLVLRAEGNPTSDFTLVDHSGLGLVEDRPGPDQVIDLRKLPDKRRVKINFSLVAAPDLEFHADARKSFGIQPEEQGCPTKERNGLDQFIRRGISENRKRVTLHDKNTDGGRYRFAVFVYKQGGAIPVATCDPRIINK